MRTTLRSLWRKLSGQPSKQESSASLPAPERNLQPEILALEIGPDDPLLAYFQSSPGVVQVDELNLESPTLQALKAAGVHLTVPLVSQGQLIGVLNLGARLSDQEYSSDDRRLLSNLASQAAPAVRVAQLVQQQQLEARQRERIEQELRVARIIQETLLPRTLPELAGWRIAAYWQPAQAVGGDFYDFISLPGGKLGIVIADVTDKGVPAALVMASTRSMLRGVAERYTSPGQVLERVNNLLCHDMPPKMFVTCLYAIFDQVSGHIWFANAGHNLPSQSTASGVVELRARGMPLGLLPNMMYEEAETVLAPGDRILLYSDGLVEAHSPQHEMFGFGRLRHLLSTHAQEADTIEWLQGELAAFTGPQWVQEDDVTLVTLERLASTTDENARVDAIPHVLAEFHVPSQPGNERQAMEQVVAVVTQRMVLPQRTLDCLKTAVAEATMNAMEHGNKFQADLAAEIQVIHVARQLIVRITDHGGGQSIPVVHEPDLQAKLDGLQSPRGWGLFLIKNMVDEMRVSSDDQHHTIELIFNL